MKIAYFDCFSGISGDMTLGALLDAGLPLADLQAALAALQLPEFSLEVRRVQKCGISATSVTVNAMEGHVHRGLPEIRQIIVGSQLPEAVQQASLRVFETLAVAEARIHGSSPDQVHFHEVGAVDAIVDIVGACFGLHHLGVEQLFCSQLPTGGGQVRSAHGLIPVPAPATLALLASRQVPVYDNGQRIELVTPTGAALMVALASGFGAFPAMAVTAIGYGAGQKELSVANVLRLVVGDAAAMSVHSHDHGRDQAQAHSHVHAHGHSHDHQHDHAHEHQHVHDHEHDHSHQHDHSHEHVHEHQHDHACEHKHEHSHSPSPAAEPRQ